MVNPIEVRGKYGRNAALNKRLRARGVPARSALFYAGFYGHVAARDSTALLRFVTLHPSVKYQLEIIIFTRKLI